MRCTYCGNELKEGAKFCNQCGTPVLPDPVTNLHDSEDDPYIDGFEPITGDDPDGDASSGEPVKKKFEWKDQYKYIAIAAFIVIAAAGGLIVRYLRKPVVITDPGRPIVQDVDEDDNEVSGEDVTEEDFTSEDQDETVDIEPAVPSEQEKKDVTEVPVVNDTEPGKDPSNTFPAEEPEVEEPIEDPGTISLPYTDNINCSINNNLSTDAFAFLECEEGGYNILYPKYLFNNVTYDSDNCEYYFSYETGGDTICSLRVYRESDRNNDPVGTAKKFRRRFDNLMYEGHYYWPNQDLSKLTTNPDSSFKEPRGDGMSRYIVSGWVDSSKTQFLYAMGANDGMNSYFLEFYYPEYDVNNDEENWDYVTECIYRGCSFSGTSYDLRSYEQYRTESYNEGHH